MNPSRPNRGGRLAYAAYDAVVSAALVVALPLLPLWRRRGPGQGLGERLGRLPPALASLPAPPVWLHAASVGEVLSVTSLVRRLRAALPQTPIVVSTTTLTGQRVAREELGADAVTLLPIDSFHIVDRVFRRVRPRLLLIVETEIWPGLMRAAHRIDCPVVVVSGKLGESAFAGYRRFAPLFRAVLEQISAFGMQTEADGERIVSLGAPPERVRVTGSLKASRDVVDASVPPLPGLTDRPVLLAASTQPGEEEVILEACSRLWDEAPELLLVLAPRRPERFREVAEMLERRRVSHVCRTVIGEGGVTRPTRVLLLDTVGELVRYYPWVRAAFVGGTIAPIGGHNVLEPATFGRAVCFGPDTANVAEAAAALEAAGGGRRIRNAEDLAAHWSHLLRSSEEAKRMGERARRVAEGRADALTHTWDLLRPYLPQ